VATKLCTHYLHFFDRCAVHALNGGCSRVDRNEDRGLFPFIRINVLPSEVEPTRYAGADHNSTIIRTGELEMANRCVCDDVGKIRHVVGGEHRVVEDSVVGGQDQEKYVNE
jgi:hypothetical protein